jgi:two-component system, cell cycle sensor histidine kinase and response regulator CckA
VDSPHDPAAEVSLLFTANPVPMWVFDLETLRFLEVNPAAVKAYGYSRDEFLAMTIADIRPPEHVAAVVADVRSRQSGELRKSGLWRHRRKDGTPMTVLITAQAIEFQGRPARLALAQDVSERERLATELEGNRRFLQTVLDGMPAVVFVKDRDSRFLLVNSEWEQVTGVAREAAVGRSNREIFPPEVAEQMRRADIACLLAGERTEEELSLPTEGGPRTFLSSRFPLRDERGELDGLIGLALDISERKRGEEQQARLGRVVEQASESILVTDAEGTILYVNPAFESISGFTAAEAVGANPRILKSGTQDEAFYRRMWETLVRGEVWKGRLVNRRKDGTLFQEDATIGPVRDAGGRIVNFVAVKRDVTHEMRLERQVIQAQKMQAVGRLAGGVAHDFNNLLAVISGYGEMTRGELAEDDPRRANLDQILKAAERAAGLVRQLLAFSRQQVFRPRVLDLNALVAGMETMLRRLIGEDVELRTAREPTLGNVRSDFGQLEQVLLNLAVNARDAMPDGGLLTIATANVRFAADDEARPAAVPPGSYVALAVTDSGVGMDAETQSHLFEPFFTTKEIGKGTGLGLSTVYGIVRQSEGYVGCESAPGEGTTFRIYLPRVDEEVAPDLAPPAARPAPGSETVLLIEDDPSLRDLLSRVLEGAGYTVLVAHDGVHAQRIAGEYDGPIHLIVTDVIMPGLTGRQAAETIQEARPEVEILFISGYSGEAIERHGIESSQARFLGKPFTPGELLHKVRERLDAG